MIRVDYLLADLTEHGIRAAVVNCNGDVTWVFDRESLLADPDATLDDASACVTAIANESFRVQLRPVGDIAS